MSKRILIVEDTKDLLANMQELFLMEGFIVHTANNGQEGLAILNEGNPDIIITDLLMPLVNGFDFITNVRAQEAWKHVPILVFSAMPIKENEEKVLKMGANYYLMKPSTLENLLDAVTKLIYHA